MKFDRVLVPEIILGKRGMPQAIEFYKMMLKDVCPEVTDGKIGVRVPSDFMNMMDANTIEHILVSKIFRDKGNKTYYLSNDFSVALSKLDREIPVNHLPKEFVGYFILGSGALKDESGSVDGGFVYIGPGDALGLSFVDGTPRTETVLSINYFNTSLYEGGIGEIYRFNYSLKDLEAVKLGDFLKANADLSKDSVLTDLGLEQKVTDPADLATRAPVLRALVNAVLYAASDEPEVCKLLPLSSYSNKKRVEVKKTVPAQNLCTIPIIMLNHTYKEGITYSVGSTVVQAHLRWQRCGPQLSKVKLIWVKEHERHYDDGQN